MKVLLTGATGYIGKQLLFELIQQGHEVYCTVRDANRFRIELPASRVKVYEVDFLQQDSLDVLPKDIDAAYYLMHSLSGSIDKFESDELKVALNFKAYINQTTAQQIIYLGGIVNEESLSPHLISRKKVEDLLRSSKVPLTALRAGIIIGSGSASFEIIRDLAEKLPFMITPRWVLTRSQPIASKNVLEFLKGVLGKEFTYHHIYDIAGPDILTYRQMLLDYAKVRNLTRYIITVPVMTPRLSSYWLYFITAISYKLAVNLVNSMKIEVIARKNDLAKNLGITLISYREAVRLAFSKLDQKYSASWKDSFISSDINLRTIEYSEVPKYGCFVDFRNKPIKEPMPIWSRIKQIGGDRGWYYASFLWKIRGFIDKLVGGVGLRRGRTHPTMINEGDALDFWRVLRVDDQNFHLILYAEMKLPGEAWLEFRIMESGGRFQLLQRATFRPKGLAGRLYWFAIWPLHILVFRGMLRKIAQ